MIASILHKLDSLANEHPDKLLYSYLDLNGNPIEGYTYGSFLHRTKVIAGHLRKEHRFAAQDRLLLAYPPGLEMICAFMGCVRAGLIPVPVYPPVLMASKPPCTKWSTSPRIARRRVF